jgi:hypothetical protein
MTNLTVLISYMEIFVAQIVQQSIISTLSRPPPF